MRDISGRCILTAILPSLRISIGSSRAEELSPGSWARSCGHDKRAGEAGRMERFSFWYQVFHRFILIPPQQFDGGILILQGKKLRIK